MFGIWLRWILSGSKAVLVTGTRGFRTLEQWGAPRGRLYNFPFATDVNYFIPAKGFPRPFSSAMKIFSSGRLEIAHKGYDTALGALALLKQRRPSVKFTYTIAGSGPDEAEVRRLIEKHNLQEYVTLVGWVETDALLQQYQNADVLLHAGVDDPFPNAVLEAMACGLIVVGSDTSGSAVERVDDRVNGLIHQTHSEESVFDCLSYLADRSEKEIMELRQNAFNTARQWGVEYNQKVLTEILLKNE
jgi:glycosyltransferase involved in cell wall biosynthesis